MKKTLKIIGISLACLVGLVLIAAIVALSTVTSSKQLTRLAKKYVPELVPFDLQLERASLTLVKTFPDIGLEVDDVAILSPMEGCPSDTLARVEKLILSANARKFLKEKQIVVNRCILENSNIILFTDQEGHSNLDIFKSQDDDTATKPFDYEIDLKEVQLKNTNLAYINLQKDLKAGLESTDIDINGQMKGEDIDALLALKAASVQLATAGLTGSLQQLELGFDGRIDDYNRIDGTLNINSPDGSLNTGYDVLKHDNIHLHLPVTLALDTLKGTLTDAGLQLNDILFSIDDAAFGKKDSDLTVNAAFHTNAIDLEDVLTRLPEKVNQSLQGIRFQGLVELANGKVEGVVNDSIMPRITADVTASDAVISIPQLPYPFTGTTLQTALTLDLNDSINANDLQLTTTMNHSKIKATGAVTDLSRKLALDLAINGDMTLADLKPFLPKGTDLKGKADLKLTTKGNLDDLLQTVTKYQFHNRLKADGHIALRNFSFDMDTLHAAAPGLDLALSLPASRKVKGATGALVSLAGERLQLDAGNNIHAEMTSPTLETTLDNLNKGLEGLLAHATLDLKRLDLRYDTIIANIVQPDIALETQPRNDKKLHAKASLKSGSINASAGPFYRFNSEALALSLTADTTADFVLTNAMLQVPQIAEQIHIPTIDFVANTKEIGFRKGGVKVGKSDIALKGNVIGFDKWKDNPDHLLKAELQINSNYLDINEIMDLTSGLGSKDDNAATADDDSQGGNPFMVPKGIDFTVNLHSKKALYDNFDLNNLNGTATIKDGTLLLREIGFTNEAAEMQLTAIYQSPKKSHLFLGMDFHLLNVQIHDLLHMIPEIDTIVPMLKTFDGTAEFHIAAQANLDSKYNLKMSTLRASADIEGADLSVRDIADFTKITDMLKVSTNGEYRIDSIDIQMTAFRDEVDLWPFQISIGKYKATLDGHYNLNTIGQYHISVTESPLPTRLGLKITGPLDNLSYSLEPCKYPNLYKPTKRNDTEQLVMQLKQQIASKLKENVQ